MAAFLAKAPEAGKPLHIRHFQIEGNGVKAGKLVGQLKALGKTGSGGDRHPGIGSAKMAGCEITAEAVFISQEKAHGIAPFPKAISRTVTGNK